MARAVGWLAEAQSDDGEFPSVVATRADMGGVTAPDTNYFTTPQVMWSLGFARDRRVKAMLRRAARFVAAGEEGGAWRFFSPKVRRRIDPDVDATGCAAAALLRAGDASRESLAACRAALLRHRDEAGRFFTWMRAGATNDLDSVANANVLWFLGDDPEAAGAARWLCALVNEGRAEGTFPYYETPLALFHAMARARFAGSTALAPADEAVRAAIGRHVRSDGSFGHALDTAFAVCALHNLGAGESELAQGGVRALLGLQRRDGAWPSCAAWNGPEWPAPRSVWWGGEAWTTALALEALARSSV